jgi:XRE family transcriptional regulator, regulator of sulfur utilization
MYDPDPLLAQVLRTIRVERGMSQEHVAHRAGLTVSSLSRIERASANPTWTTLVRITDALDISLHELVARLDDLWQARGDA